MGIPKGLRFPRPAECPGHLWPDVPCPVAGSCVTPCSRLPHSSGKAHGPPRETELALMRVSSGSRGPAQARGSRERRRRSREGVSLRHQSCRSQALSWGREFGAATDSAPPGVLLQARGPGLPRLPMSALRVPDTLLSSALCLLLPVLKFTHRGPSLMGKGEKARLLRDSQKSQLQRKAQASLGDHPPPLFLISHTGWFVGLYYPMTNLWVVRNTDLRAEVPLGPLGDGVMLVQDSDARFPHSHPAAAPGLSR